MSISQLFDAAAQLDKKDPLKVLREKFQMSHKTVYLDGNSLGLLPKSTRKHLDHVIQQEWGKQVIKQWNKSWFKLSQTTGNKIGKLLGANDGEVIVSDSTSVNMYKLILALLPLSERRKILSDDLNFPSNLYLIKGIIQQQLGKKYELDLLKSEDGLYIETEQIINALKSKKYNILVLSHVSYLSAQQYDMKFITEQARQFGTSVIWDLSHSAGAVSIDLNRSNIEYAVGCTYKYLNGGPGSPAFIYINHLQQKIIKSQPIWGWFGTKNAFDFDTKYNPYSDLRKFLVGTPPILSLSALESSIDFILAQNLNEIWSKRTLLITFFLESFDKHLSNSPYNIKSKRNLDNQGSHILLEHPESARITKALISSTILNLSIVPDFRAPNYIRIGFAPMYNSFNDIAGLIKQLKYIEEKQVYRNFTIENQTVT